MSVSTVLSRASIGMMAPQVRVEVHVGPGLPAFFLVGLPETVVRESKERVRAALQTAGFVFPPGRITVNLAPADLPKEGGRFDLPIAIGILAASEQLIGCELMGHEFYGELGLDGALRETAKLLPALRAGRDQGYELVVPEANALEAGTVGGRQIKVANHLNQVCEAMRGGTPLNAPRSCAWPEPEPTCDLVDVRGQFAAKRALEVAAAGGHGLLMIGPPGAGKTMLAQRLPGLLPPLEMHDALEVASLRSAAGLRPCIDGRRPFRSPQHTASLAALIGGAALRPGELSLAHLGVLFLDELPEFARNVLEALREPLESGVVTLLRAKRSYEFPARFQLVAAMNPCPCGYAGDARKRCRCTQTQVSRYRGKLSAPLVDRIDIHIELAALADSELSSTAGDAGVRESSAQVAARVAAAQILQKRRQGTLNAKITLAQIDHLCELGRESRALLAAAVERLGLSARAYHRVLKVARTCADLAGEPQIRRVDVSEAINLRTLDREVGRAPSR